MTFKLYAVRIFTREWEKGLHFYENILELPIKFKEASLGWAEFDVGGPSLGLERVAQDDPEGQELVGRFVGLSLQVDDIEQTYSLLTEKGVEFLGAPERQPWGGTLAHFRDPDGNTLTLLG